MADKDSTATIRQAKKLAALASPTKTCTKCGETKARDKFGKDAKRSGGLRTYCKSCHNGINGARRNVAPEVQRAASARWAENNWDKKLRKSREWAQRYPERMAAFAREWRSRNPDRARELQALRGQSPTYRMHRAISTGLYLALKSKRGRRTKDILGYGVDELMVHLDRQFTPGMTWENYGQWHVDHIVPLASFKLSGPDDPEVRRAWGLPNLRPLWARENRKKHAKRVFLI